MNRCSWFSFTKQFIQPNATFYNFKPHEVCTPESRWCYQCPSYLTLPVLSCMAQNFPNSPHASAPYGHVLVHHNIRQQAASSLLTLYQLPRNGAARSFDWPLSISNIRHCDTKLQREHKKVAPPLRLLLVFQLWVQIFAWNFTRLSKNQITHFITKFGWNIWENDKIMLFQPRQPPISQHSEHYLHG